MLPGHPETIAAQDTVKGVVAVIVVVVIVDGGGGRRGKLAPCVAVYLDDVGDLAMGRQGWLQIARGIGTQIGNDSRGGIVGQHHSLGAEKAGQQGRERGAGAELDGGQACDIKDGQVGRAAGGCQGRRLWLWLLVLGVEDSAGLDEFGQQEGGIPQVVAKQLAHVLAFGVGQADLQWLREVWGSIDEPMFCVAVCNCVYMDCYQ